MRITAPTSGSTVRGTVTIKATATDNVKVTKVQFYVDGKVFGALDTVSPFAISWITTRFTVGRHTISARAYDSVGNVGIATTIAVNVKR